MTEKQAGQPLITFADETSTPLQVASEQVLVQVTLPIARVTSILKFVNKNKQVLEGELIFPLPDEATLVGYAMDVQGVLIDAVPVEKEKARIVFEEEVRSTKEKGVALVEMAGQSNCFRVRVYPLHPEEEKTIKVVYTLPVANVNEEDSASVLSIPFRSPPSNGTIQARVEWYQKSMDDIIDCPLDLYLVNDGIRTSLKKESKRENNYMVTIIDPSDVNSSVDTLVISSSQKLKDDQITVEGKYFCARMKITQKVPSRLLSTEKIQIMWDVSFSRRNNKKRDLDLLKQILEALAPKLIVFTPFSLSVLDTYKRYNIFTNIEALIDHINKEVQYDGATDLSNLERMLDDSASFCLAFTDGLHTIGKEITPETIYSIPLYIISTSMHVNNHLLSHIATRSGGIFLNAAFTDEQQIIEQVGRPVLQFLVADYEDDKQFEQIYPNEPVVVDSSGHFHLYGIIKEGGEINVTFRLGGEIIEIKTLQINEHHSDHQQELASSDKSVTSLQWAKHKMNSLLVYPHLFDKELQELGRNFSIATASTSLIVLKELDQYLKYQIVPPVTLPSIRDQYLEKIARIKEAEQRKIQNKIEIILPKWKERNQWHVKEHLTEHRSDSDKEEEDDEGYESTRGLKRRKISETSSLPVSSSTRTRITSRVSTGGKAPRMSSSSVEAVNPKENECSATIKLQLSACTETYMAVISESPNPYHSYLEQRLEYENSPSFFLNVADYWLKHLKNSELGLTILTNILELEIDNVQLFRIVAYRLDQEMKYELAELVLEKVKKMRPDEPQSYRDLALIKEKLGKYSEAVDLLNKVITGEWASRFDEIELTAAIELNHVLLRDPNLMPCDERFRYTMDLDLRVSMAWDTDDTDIDLHIQEPSVHGQHCYYGNRHTTLGGLLSRDFTKGYGPEEYMLRKAPSGEFIVSANFFANHKKSLSGGTTILLTFFTNYMRQEEKSETVTLRLTSDSGTERVCIITKH